jgi:hypothetical protein
MVVLHYVLIRATYFVQAMIGGEESPTGFGSKLGHDF